MTDTPITLTADSLLADFSAGFALLKTHAEDMIAQSAAKAEASAKLLAEKAEHDLEATKAYALIEKLKGLFI